jgi:hypothetical protein
MNANLPLDALRYRNTLIKCNSGNDARFFDTDILVYPFDSDAKDP